MKQEDYNATPASERLFIFGLVGSLLFGILTVMAGATQLIAGVGFIVVRDGGELLKFIHGFGMWTTILGLISYYLLLVDARSDGTKFWILMFLPTLYIVSSIGISWLAKSQPLEAPTSGLTYFWPLVSTLLNGLCLLFFFTTSYSLASRDAMSS